MTEQGSTRPDELTGAGTGPAGEAPMAGQGEGRPTDEPGGFGGPQSGQAREWMAQLQSMIENLATQAAPVVREVGAKAAELAAVAAEKAGPIAAKAAEVTADAGTRFAERSRNLATELRRDADAANARTESTSTSEPSAGSPMAGSAGAEAGGTSPSDGDAPTTVE